MNKISSVNSLNYCRNFARDADYNLYLLHFFAPRPCRKAIIALVALHCEIMQIPIKAKDNTMIILRLKWWYESVMALFSSTTPTANSPILQALSSFIEKSDDTQRLFETYFTATEDYFNGKESADPQAVLYELMAQHVPNQKDRDRLIGTLQYHDQLDDAPSPIRAIRLWIRGRTR